MLSEKHCILVETAVRSARATPILVVVVVVAATSAQALGCGARVAAVNVVAVLQDTAQRHGAPDDVGRLGCTAIIMTDDRAILVLAIAVWLQARIAKVFKLREIAFTLVQMFCSRPSLGRSCIGLICGLREASPDLDPELLFGSVDIQHSDQSLKHVMQAFPSQH